MITISDDQRELYKNEGYLILPGVIPPDMLDKVFDPSTLGEPVATAGWELQNMLTVCGLITQAAYTRTESRGAHYRLDYPARDDAHWRLHLLWRRPMETPIPEPID